MKIFICILLACAAALFVQTRHWQKIYSKPTNQRKRYTQPVHFIISAVFIVASAVLGLVATAFTNDVIAYVFAAAIGFAPWETIKLLMKKPPTFGPEEMEEQSPASLGEFIKL